MLVDPWERVRALARDMLAWVHQSLASERELLMSLFGEDEVAQRQGEPPPADMPGIRLLLDRVFESICKPLKVHWAR
jgi:conserved oligomeric Golgi complex subunit 6